MWTEREDAADSAVSYLLDRKLRGKNRLNIDVPGRESLGDESRTKTKSVFARMKEIC